MARSYTLKKRAEQQAETRQHIVEAAVELHAKLGPAATTFSMVAERAGVQRHTLYAHFPDERSLLMACSGHAEVRDPVPEAAAWRGIADVTQRLTTGLRTIYAWFERNEVLLGNVLRDAEHHKTVQEVGRLRYGPAIAGWHDVLGAKLNAKQRAMLHLALSFHTWRSLTREARLKSAAAVEAMVGAVNGAAVAASARKHKVDPSHMRPKLHNA
jgi:AcrR family transcriptional regulator